MSKNEDNLENLARKLAKLLKDEDNLKLYEYMVKHYKRKAIDKAYEDTMKVPNNKIKKTRSALFFYLVKKYDSEKEPGISKS